MYASVTAADSNLACLCCVLSRFSSIPFAAALYTPILRLMTFSIMFSPSREPLLSRGVKDNEAVTAIPSSPSQVYSI